MARKSGSKYAAIVPGLPELPVDAKWQTKIDLVKSKLLEEAKDPRSLMTAYVETRQQIEALDAQRGALNVKLEAAVQLLVESHNRQEPGWGEFGTTSNTLLAPDGSRVRVDTEPYVSVVDADANRKWAIENGLERKLTLNWQVLNKVVKDLLVAGKPEPPGVKTFKKRTIAYTSAKAPETPEPEVEEWSPDMGPLVDEPF